MSFVISNLANDMHDGTVMRADAWLKAHLRTYANWARRHNSLLIVTLDEDDYRLDNRIFTVFYGAGIKPGRYVERIDYYTLLRTIEDIEGQRRWAPRSSERRSAASGKGDRTSRCQSGRLRTTDHHRLMLTDIHRPSQAW